MGVTPTKEEIHMTTTPTKEEIHMTTTPTGFSPAHYALSEVEQMRAADCGFAIHYLPYTGVEWAVGCAPTPDGVFWGNLETPCTAAERAASANPVSGMADTLEEALIAMVNAARAQMRSQGSAHIFAANCNIDLHEDQRSVEELSGELHAKIGPFDLTFNATDPDPYATRWTLAPEDPALLGLSGACTAMGGYNAREVLLEALTRSPA